MAIFSFDLSLVFCLFVFFLPSRKTDYIIRDNGES